MEKIVIFFLFIYLFIFLIRKDVVYFIPMIFLFYSNINALLDWEDFAKHGVIKFPDYGLVLSVCICFYFIYLKRGKAIPILKTQSGLLLLICLQIYYYLFLFGYSVVLQGSIEWPIKIGRYFFFGSSILVFYLLLYPDPENKYKKIVTFLKIYTIIFSVMYIIYNHFHINFYADEPFEMVNSGKADVTRNFAAIPYFLMYFYCITLIDFFNRKGNLIINSLLIFLFLICMISTITRGLIITAAIIFISAFIISDNRRTNIIYVFFFLGIGILLLNYIHYFESGSFSALMERSSEIRDAGIRNTGNFEYRTQEFLNIFNNVVQFNPFFGFGFVNTDLLGYHFNHNSAYSPDNGYTNLLGVSGFIGLAIFMAIIIKWGFINIKLQRLKIDDFSKAHFLFIISIFLSFLNGSSMSYLQSFGLFLIYDLLIYRVHFNSLI